MDVRAFRTTAFAALAMTMISGASVADPAGPLQASEMKWGPAPPVFPKGAELAVLAGDPAKEGPVTVRLKMPKDYAIPAHWHPTDERVTVISGELGLGMGDKLDKKASKVLKAGGYAVAPAHMNHYAWTKSGAVVQVDLMGPFALTYVNPADDPSKK
jgi:quercetin dioxygenase-like cupin family protein